MAADKSYPKQEEGLKLGRGGISPKWGTFTPPASYRVFRVIQGGLSRDPDTKALTKARPR